MEILVVTNMFPSYSNPYYGIFIKEQLDSIRSVDEKIHFTVSFINGKESKMNYIKAIKEISEIVKTAKINLLHAHYGLSAISAELSLLLGQKKIPVVTTFHGSDIYIYWQRLISFLAAAKADFVIAVNEQFKEILGRFNKNIEVIPMGVDTELFKPLDKEYARMKLNIPINRKILLFGGNPCNKIKRFDLFIDTYKTLKKIYPNDISYLILNNIKRELVPFYINASDVLVVTSLYESGPMVVKEAMSCNVPIVSVNVGDVQNLLKNVQNCFVTSNSLQDICEAIVTVLDSGERSTGREKIFKLGLDIISIAKKIISLYYKLTN
jgi:glycosyltransferase involved in cell wall biosynthesis